MFIIVTQVRKPNLFSILNYKVFPTGKTRLTSQNMLFLSMLLLSRKGLVDLGQLLVLFLYIIVLNIHPDFLKNSQVACSATNNLFIN